MGPMNGHLITMDGKELEASPEEVKRLLAASVPFWLDLQASSGHGGAPDDPVHELLRDTFHIHPLALEDSEHFGQRPKLDMYDDFALLVAYGPGDSDRLTE